jgi:hypothetical protein
LYYGYGAASPFLEIDRCGCLGGDAKRLITADAYLIEIKAEKMRGYLSTRAALIEQAPGMSLRQVMVRVGAAL